MLYNKQVNQTKQMPTSTTSTTSTDATYAEGHQGLNLFQRINLAQCALDRSRLPGVVVTERWSGEYDSAKLWGKTMATSAIC